MKRMTAVVLMGLLFWGEVRGQSNDKPDHDTTYYRSFKGTIIGRLYLSRSYLPFKMDPPAGTPALHYPVNKALSLGVGITYKSLSFSFSKGLNFLHSNKDK